MSCTRRNMLTTVVLVGVDGLVGDLLALCNQVVDSVVVHLNALFATIRVVVRVRRRLDLFGVCQVLGGKVVEFYGRLAERSSFGENLFGGLGHGWRSPEYQLGFR